MTSVLVTGCAGFIGFHVARRLLEEGQEVVGLDNLNEYYDPALKAARLSQLTTHSTFRFVKCDVADRGAMAEFFGTEKFEYVVHLAAQAGVRYSLTHPFSYIDANLLGFANILEGCRKSATKHLVFASSSSVYGANTKMPFSVHDEVGHPVSLYAATKRANELMAHAYAHLYGIPCTGLRLFTVYGPWGRPDMALFLFTKCILSGEPIEVYNYGNMRRDFTYIDDVTEPVVRVMRKIPGPDPNWNSGRPDVSSSSAPFRIYNIGNGNPANLLQLVKLLEARLGREAKINFLPLQPGDLPATYSDNEDLEREIDYRPQTPIEVGVDRFVQWYRSYYRI